MDQSPYFSVVMPLYNHGRYVLSSISSVLQSTFQDFELVVVDDASTDNGPHLVQKLSELDSRVRLLRSERNGGCAAALNIAIASARGRYICWLSSDDLMLADCLARHHKAIVSDPELQRGDAFIYSDCKHLYSSDVLKSNTAETSTLLQGIVPTFKNHEDPRLNLIIDGPELYIPNLENAVLQFFRHNYIYGNSICIKRESLTRDNLQFDIRLRNAQDFAMWLNLSRTTVPKFQKYHSTVIRMHNESGTNLAPYKGIYDSAFALLEFCNNFRLGEFFKYLQVPTLLTPFQVINLTLDVVCCWSGFLYQCVGYTPYLADRLIEYVSEMNDLRYLDEIANTASAAIDKVGPNFPAIGILRRLASAPSLHPFSYRRYDFIAEATKHMANLQLEERHRVASYLASLSYNQPFSSRES